MRLSGFALRFTGVVLALWQECRRWLVTWKLPKELFAEAGWGGYL